MAKNKLSDLNDHMFMQLERLNDESLSGDKLKEEVTRTQAISSLAREVIAGGHLLLRAKLAAENNISGQLSLPPMLG